MQGRIQWFLAFLLVVLAPACPAQETRTWQREGVRFSLQYPATMQVIDKPEQLAAAGVAVGNLVDSETELKLGVQAMMQLNSPGSPGVNPTLTIGTQPAEKEIRGWSPEKFARTMFDAMPQAIPGARNVEPLRTTTLAGLTFWTGSTEFVTGGQQLRLKQWIRYEPRDKIIYLFSVADQVSSFADNIGRFEGILATLDFSGKARLRGDALVTATAPATPVATAPAAMPASSAGDPVPGKDYVEEIFIHWQPARTPDAKLIEQRMRANPLLVNVARGLDTAFRFPRRLDIHYSEVGEVNAWYSPSEHSVTMTYDLGVYLAKVFMQAGHSQEQSITMAVDAMVFVLLHELGHALVGELQLPVTGKEEDSADEFATMMAAMVLPDQSAPTARAAALWFDLQGGQVQSVAQMKFWDEHSLDRQRTYRILANLYAHAPKQFRGVENSIPAERLQEAQLRWPGKLSRWQRLFSPWLEEGAWGERNGIVAAPGGTRPVDAGRIRFEMRDLSNARSLTLKTHFDGINVFGRYGDSFNGPFIWPRNYTVAFSDAVGMRSTLDLRKGESVIGMDYLWQVGDKLAAKYGPQKGAEMFVNMFSYLLIQETTRAMLHEMQLAYTGEEEDAAAELTALAMISGAGGEGVIEAAAAWYGILKDEQVSLEQLKLWSPGALDPQRFYDLLGWLHASNPAKYGWVADIIPANRLARARQELPLKTNNWGRHLSPWGARP